MTYFGGRNWVIQKRDGGKDGKAQRTGEKELAETQMEGSGS